MLQTSARDKPVQRYRSLTGRDNGRHGARCPVSTRFDFPQLVSGSADTYLRDDPETACKCIHSDHLAVLPSVMAHFLFAGFTQPRVGNLLNGFADQIVGEDRKKDRRVRGNNTSHHICRLDRPAFNNVPQLGWGGGGPKPRKLSPLSIRIAEATPKLIGTNTGCQGIGQNVTEDDPRPGRPKLFGRPVRIPCFSGG